MEIIALDDAVEELGLLLLQVHHLLLDGVGGHKPINHDRSWLIILSDVIPAVRSDGLRWVMSDVWVIFRKWTAPRFGKYNWLY